MITKGSMNMNSIKTLTDSNFQSVKLNANLLRKIKTEVKEEILSEYEFLNHSAPSKN
jgi:hypothetical protein